MRRRLSMRSPTPRLTQQALLALPRRVMEPMDSAIEAAAEPVRSEARDLA
jgi:hypothetical protein